MSASTDDAPLPASSSGKSSATDLDSLGPFAFEHLVNALALRVLGPGLTFFGHGRDGGRDALFDGSAPYPSSTDHWSGRWYIQSKFRFPGEGGKDPQQWLRTQISKEIEEFARPDSQREWPDIWIVATNVDPSPVPSTGTHDKALAAVRSARTALAERFHIWGKKKLLEFLAAPENADVAKRYRHLTTPGNILAEIERRFERQTQTLTRAVRSWVCDGFTSQSKSRLEEAGSEDDHPPPVHEIFVDLPFHSGTDTSQSSHLVSALLASAVAENHRSGNTGMRQNSQSEWNASPARAAVWFIKAGPGHGKSTIGQFISQIHRTALIRASHQFGVGFRESEELLDGVETAARRYKLWPTSPRVPIFIDLKGYASWMEIHAERGPAGVRTYISHEIHRITEEKIDASTLLELFELHRWLIVFDGLDEVPSGEKDGIAREISKFIHESRQTTDLFTICTSRPQGYSGQFDTLGHCATVELVPLDAQQAVECGTRLLDHWLPKADVNAAVSRLAHSYANSSAVRDLMRTPLQVHIIAVIVRNGRTPPERRWRLFNEFFRVILQREANKLLAAPGLAALLRTEEKLIRDIHGRLAFYLHASAEGAAGAQAELDTPRFKELVRVAVSAANDDNIDVLTDCAVMAARERLVLISTPTKKEQHGFDIRQLQEFFAAEHIYRAVDDDELRRRLSLITSDQHWREVTHFILSALAENDHRTRLEIAAAAIRSADRGEGGPNSLERTLARGAMHTSRLIDDGVFDHDKSIRAIFEDTLDPVFTHAIGPTPFEWLRPSLSHPRRRWLVRRCLEWCLTLGEARRQEVMHLLWNGIDDSSPDLPEVIDLFDDASDNVLMAEVNRFYYEPGRQWHATVFKRRLDRTHGSPRCGELLATLLLGQSRGRRQGAVLSGILADTLGGEQTRALRSLGPTITLVKEVEIYGADVQVFSLTGASQNARANVMQVAEALPALGWQETLRRMLKSIAEATRENWTDLRASPSVDAELAARIRVRFCPAFEGDGDRQGQGDGANAAPAHFADISAGSRPSAEWAESEESCLRALAAEFPVAAIDAGVALRRRDKVDRLSPAEIEAAGRLALEGRHHSRFDAALLASLLDNDIVSIEEASGISTGDTWGTFAVNPCEWETSVPALMQHPEMWPTLVHSLTFQAFESVRRKPIAPEAIVEVLRIGETLGKVFLSAWEKAIEDSQLTRHIRQAACLWTCLATSKPDAVFDNQSELFTFKGPLDLGAQLVASWILVFLRRDDTEEARFFVSQAMKGSRATANLQMRWLPLLSLWRERSLSPVTTRAEDLLLEIIPEG